MAGWRDLWMSSPPDTHPHQKAPFPPNGAFAFGPRRGAFHGACGLLMDAGHSVKLGFEFFSQLACGHHVLFAFGVALHGIEILFRSPLGIVRDVLAAKAAMDVG